MGRKGKLWNEWKELISLLYTYALQAIFFFEGIAGGGSKIEKKKKICLGDVVETK